MAVDRRSSAQSEPVRPQPPARQALTRAEQRALRRSTPLTAVQFKELRRLAEQGISPLRHI